MVILINGINTIIHDITVKPALHKTFKNTVNIILDSLGYNQAADMNEDGNIDVLDVISIVNLILQ